MREPFSVVDILIPRDAAVDGLAEQIGERKLVVLPAPRITQVLGDQFRRSPAVRPTRAPESDRRRR